MIELPHTWASTTLEDVYTLHYGKSLTKRARTTSGSYPVLGSSGVVGSHTAFLVQGPVIVVRRKGAAGSVTFCKENCWPIDTTYFVKPPEGIDVPFAGLWPLACPIFCTGEIVSVARRVIDMPRRRSRGCGKVGSAFCFPLFHAPGELRSAMQLALVICSPAMNVA